MDKQIVKKITTKSMRMTKKKMATKRKMVHKWCDNVRQIVKVWKT